jgi:hypothetical protein
MAIDTIQNAKLEFLRHTMKDESIKKPLEDFVEAQRKFTKQIAKSGCDLISVGTESMTRFFFGSNKTEKTESK